MHASTFGYRNKQYLPSIIHCMLPVLQVAWSKLEHSLCVYISHWYIAKDIGCWNKHWIGMVEPRHTV